VQEHISQPRESVKQTACVPRKQKTASCGRHAEPGDGMAREPATTGEASGRGTGGAGAEGVRFGGAAEETDDDDEAEAGEPIEPRTEDEGAVGEEPGPLLATGPADVAGALAVWFARAASAIWAAPATAANPAATA
jgi:hypothetical protein